LTGILSIHPLNYYKDINSISRAIDDGNGNVRAGYSEFNIVNILQSLRKVSLTSFIRFWNYNNFCVNEKKRNNKGRNKDGKNQHQQKHQQHQQYQQQYQQQDGSKFIDPEIYFNNFIFTEFRSNWGSPLLSIDDDGFSCDIARAKKVLNGHLIIFTQNDFWRNKYIGMTTHHLTLLVIK
jgi:hypothetical protein